jgi:hypothetical protein
LTKKYLENFKIELWNQPLLRLIFLLYLFIHRLFNYFYFVAWQIKNKSI